MHRAIWNRRFPVQRPKRKEFRLYRGYDNRRPHRISKRKNRLTLVVFWPLHCNIRRDGYSRKVSKEAEQEACREQEPRRPQDFEPPVRRSSTMCFASAPHQQRSRTRCRNSAVHTKKEGIRNRLGRPFARVIQRATSLAGRRKNRNGGRDRTKTRRAFLNEKAR